MTEPRLERPLSRLRNAGTALVAGAIFGLFAPVIGVFAGLVLLPQLGTLLTAPIILLSVLIDTPMGYMSPAFRILGWGLSALFWAAVAFAIHCAIAGWRGPR